MHFKFVNLLTIIALCGGCLGISIELQKNGATFTQDDSAPDRACTREGIMCLDCKTLVSCRKNSNGDGFAVDKVLLCPEYAPCDESKLGCSTDAEPRCRYKKFECADTGLEYEQVYPDPYSCTQYHGCVGDEMYHYTCLGDSSFDIINQNCSGKITDDGCKMQPIDLCVAASENRPVGKSEVFQCKCIEDTKNKIIYPEITLIHPPTTPSTNATTTKTTPTTPHN
ncbi:uncharacterized protein LOC124157817 [Ischnura elegans]|uniref:uncharacterized protein LOC124157817 n=1 Tax=Ischnura elegans TaxID=197161 RepID=UPI001ED871CD|nr:uncharacterized protein LOC124157817 [Ischnura elegans]